MKKINFNQQLKDAFGNVVVVKNKEGVSKNFLLHEELVAVLSHPDATPKNEQLTQMQIISRMKLSMKIAEGKTAEYNDDEISIIRTAVMLLYNERLLNLALSARILELIETK